MEVDFIFLPIKKLLQMYTNGYFVLIYALLQVIFVIVTGWQRRIYYKLREFCQSV